MPVPLLTLTAARLLAATPPDVGDSIGPALDQSLDALIPAFLDLATWLVPVGMALLAARSAFLFALGKSPADEFRDWGARRAIRGEAARQAATDASFRAWQQTRQPGQSGYQRRTPANARAVRRSMPNKAAYRGSRGYHRTRGGQRYYKSARPRR